MVTGLDDDVFTQLATTLLEDRKSALDGCLQKLTAEERALVHSVYQQRQRINRVAQQLNRLYACILSLLGDPTAADGRPTSRQSGVVA